MTETNTQAGAQVVTLQRRGGDKDLSDGRVAVSQASISELDTNKFSALNVTPATPTRKRDRTVNDGAESERCCH